MPTEAQRRALDYGPQPEVSAASLRGPIRGEVHALTVGTASKTFVVPTGWRGIYIRVQADGGDLYLQVSTTATNAVADKDARSTEAGSPIVPTAAGGACYKIPNGQAEDIVFPPDATTFAIQASAAACARCHPSET
jgi:hypothetical protein